tara:strand:- start:22 stop:552 length:531 start_codon:yes stop_codon:yes gene_type:complete
MGLKTRVKIFGVFLVLTAIFAVAAYFQRCKEKSKDNEKCKKNQTTTVLAILCGVVSVFLLFTIIPSKDKEGKERPGPNPFNVDPAEYLVPRENQFANVTNEAIAAAPSRTKFAFTFNKKTYDFPTAEERYEKADDLNMWIKNPELMKRLAEGVLSKSEIKQAAQAAKAAKAPDTFN